MSRAGPGPFSVFGFTIDEINASCGRRMGMGLKGRKGGGAGGLKK